MRRRKQSSRLPIASDSEGGPHYLDSDPSRRHFGACLVSEWSENESRLGCGGANTLQDQNKKPDRGKNSITIVAFIARSISVAVSCNRTLAARSCCPSCQPLDDYLVSWERCGMQRLGASTRPSNILLLLSLLPSLPALRCSYCRHSCCS